MRQVLPKEERRVAELATRELAAPSRTQWCGFTLKSGTVVPVLTQFVNDNSDLPSFLSVRRGGVMRELRHEGAVRSVPRGVLRGERQELAVG